jgi:hypothetical protein
MTMPGKCEHGLTTKECLVCASPKHGAEPRATVQRESVEDALLIVESYGPWGADLNDAHRRQIVLADEVLRLRHLYELAVRGRAEMRGALRKERDGGPMA